MQNSIRLEKGMKNRSGLQTFHLRNDDLKCRTATEVVRPCHVMRMEPESSSGEAASMISTGLQCSRCGQPRSSSCGSVNLYL